MMSGASAIGALWPHHGYDAQWTQTQPGERCSWPNVVAGVNTRAIRASARWSWYPAPAAVPTFKPMSKRSKPKSKPEYRWRVSLITATPAKFVDFTLAPDAATAERQVAEAHEISDTLRDRLVAIREDH
jgi:hypothetical protein